MKPAVGIAGTGVWAQRVHIPALSTHPDVTLAGIWGRDRAKTQAIAMRFGMRAFERYEHLLAEVDIVDLALIPGLQPAYGIQAAAAGKHLMLEKPAGTDSASVRVLSEALVRRGLSATIFLGRFYDPTRLEWLKTQAGKGWEHASAEWIAASFLEGNAFAGPWREQAGALLDVGPHVLSQLEFLLGRVADVSINQWDSQGDLSLAFRHETGAESTMRVNVHTPVAQTCESLVLTAGDLTLSSPVGPIDQCAAFGRMIDHLLSQIDRRPTDEAGIPMTGIEDGLHQVQLMERIQTAASRTPGADLALSPKSVRN